MTPMNEQNIRDEIQNNMIKHIDSMKSHIQPVKEVTIMQQAAWETFSHYFAAMCSILGLDENSELQTELENLIDKHIDKTNWNG